VAVTSPAKLLSPSKIANTPDGSSGEFGTVHRGVPRAGEEREVFKVMYSTEPDSSNSDHLPVEMRDPANPDNYLGAVKP
jgi:hypothetical protein